MPILEYVGSYTPFDETRGGIAAFAASVRAQHPGATDRDVERAVKYVLDRRTQKRYAGWIVHRFGADIMTGDLTQIPAWRWMAPDWQRQLPRHPLVGGALYVGTARDVQHAAYISPDPTQINRSSLIKPEGLSTTYVWRKENDWLQDVTEADAAVLRASKDDVFRNPERFGRWVEPRSWFGNAQPAASYRFDNEDDAHAFERDQLKKAPHWLGADLTKQPA